MELVPPLKKLTDVWYNNCVAPIKCPSLQERHWGVSVALSA